VAVPVLLAVSELTARGTGAKFASGCPSMCVNCPPIQIHQPSFVGERRRRTGGTELRGGEGYGSVEQRPTPWAGDDPA